MQILCILADLIWNQCRFMSRRTFANICSNLVFSFQNCSDFLWERKISINEKKFSKSKMKTKSGFICFCFPLTLSERGGGGRIGPPLVLIICCALKDADMNSKLLDNFSYDLIEALVKYFFDFFPTLFRKLTSNDLNPRIFSIEKTKKCSCKGFFNFYKSWTQEAGASTAERNFFKKSIF